MNRTVVIHQPDLLPYLGFFHRFLRADLWVVLDTVQFVTGTSKSWMNRDKIKAPAGEKWITVAVQKAGKNAKINEIMLAQNVDWRSNNVNLIREHYREALFFDEIFPYIEKLYRFECDRMMDFNLKSIDMLMELFDLKIRKVLASTLDPRGRSNDLLVDILTKVGASRYLSGQGARAYYDPRPFHEAGIAVIWQDFNHPVYPQLHGDFVPYLSSIDVLLNCGIDTSRKILRSYL